MLRTAWRAFLTVVLVATMAGSAVALAVGVNFSPRKTVCTPTGIPGYGPICKTTGNGKKHKKHKKHKKCKKHQKRCKKHKKHHKKHRKKSLKGTTVTRPKFTG